MPKIFISYRREDSQWPADRLYETMKPLLPERDLFIDVDNIPLGVNFVDHLDNSVAQCDVLLALIGRGWLDVRNPETGARRLDDPGDFVRVEIAAALKRGIAVVPVLLDGAAIPAAKDLPENLRELALRHGAEIRRLSFEDDAARLIRGLGLQAPGQKAAPASAPSSAAPPAQPSAGTRRLAMPVVVAGISAALAVLAVGSWIMQGGKDPSTVGSPVLSGEMNDALMTLDATRIKSYLKRGWDPNASLDSESSAALHILMLVCERNPTHDTLKLVEIARILIDAGADKTQKNKWGDTPVSIAFTPKYCGPNHPVIGVLR